MSHSELEDEQKRLEGLVSQLESVILKVPDTEKPQLSQAIEGIRQRLKSIEKEIKVKQEQAQHQDEAAYAAAVQRETALNSQEKETYSHFLQKEFFTKNDFGSLEQFYSKTWDKLTEQGKDEMSHRVWEGVRQGQYTFSELPQVVQEKESKRLYEKLHAPSLETNLSKIPEQDRADFVQAYEAGDKKAASKVLERDSFRQNVATGSTVAGHSDAAQGKEAKASSLAENSRRGATSAEELRSSAETHPELRKRLKDLNIGNIPPVTSSETVSAPSVAQVSEKGAQAGPGVC